MAELYSDRSRLMIQTANHLRLVQMDFADERADVRKGYLKDELARAVAAVTPEDRRAFPSWDMPVIEDEPKPAALKPAETDWRSLVAGLEALASSLPVSERAALCQRLEDLGLIEPPPPVVPETPSSKELLAILQDFVVRMEKLWGAWSSTSTRGVRPSGDLQDDMKNFLNGNNAAPGELNRDLERLRRLLVAPTEAVLRIDRLFQDYLDMAQLTPEAVRNAVENEGARGFGDSRYWTKYEEKYNKVRPSQAKEFRAKVLAFIEGFFANKPVR